MIFSVSTHSPLSGPVPFSVGAMEGDTTWDTLKKQW